MSAQGGVCPAGCLPGGVCLGVSAQGDVCLPMGVSAQGGVYLGVSARPPIPMDRMTDACENKTFPQLLLRTVKTQIRRSHSLCYSHSTVYVGTYSWNCMIFHRKIRDKVAN